MNEHLAVAGRAASDGKAGLGVGHVSVLPPTSAARQPRGRRREVPPSAASGREPAACVWAGPHGDQGHRADGSERAVRPCYNTALTEGHWRIIARRPGYVPASSEINIAERDGACPHYVHSVQLTMRREGEPVTNPVAKSRDSDRSASTLPIGKDGCQLEKEVRKIFGAQSAPVAASRPALGMINSVLVSLAILTMPICTPL